MSVSTSGLQGDGDSYKAEISNDGRFVVFESNATNLVAGDGNGTWDVFVHDRLMGVTELASVSSLGTQANSGGWLASISADGRYVSFQSQATNLVPEDPDSLPDIYVRDRQLGTTQLASVSSLGVKANYDCAAATISADGRYVYFVSGASNLVPGDSNGHADGFVRDLLLHTTERVTVRTDGSQVSLGGGGGSISSDGSCVVFLSDATDIVSGDTNGHTDVFLRDRFYTHFTSMCEPGQGGVVDCPCNNPPFGPGRGCDNSAGTGGAVLAASGSCHLATDSLCFTTSAEMPHATSILLQGTTLTSGGIAFGQGVRCTSGLLKRLFVKSATNGSIRAPDFGAGDATVSTRSAAVGDTIHAGETRTYVVYYRDPSVLGGCFPTSTFNCTQTGQVLWWP